MRTRAFWLIELGDAAAVMLAGQIIVAGLATASRSGTSPPWRCSATRWASSKIVGVSVTLVMVGQLIGPVVVGVLADVTGDYRLCFTLLAAVVAVASLCFVFLSPLPPRFER